TALSTLSLHDALPILSMISNTDSQVSASSISWYTRFSMNIFSREAKWYLSSNSFSWILSSARIKSLVWAVDRRRISLTSRNIGLLSTITQALGEMEISQLVKA